ncbi:hypothetical protein GCM10022207_85720 [Streptomyces lannensis]|uniref:Uncharacterized protein n=1 Tax=Streptomyces lannensis TaxID=766498 RepID=A0ABP7LQF4_9ACTN
MTDLLWDDVKWFFDPDLMGALPDVRVPNASMEDWQTVLDLVAEKGWKCQYSEGETVLPVPRAETVLSRPADAECPELRVWPTADVLAIFRSGQTSTGDGVFGYPRAPEPCRVGLALSRNAAVPARAGPGTPGSCCC